MEFKVLFKFLQENVETSGIDCQRKSLELRKDHNKSFLQQPQCDTQPPMRVTVTLEQQQVAGETRTQAG